MRERKSFGQCIFRQITFLAKRISQPKFCGRKTFRMKKFSAENVSGQNFFGRNFLGRKIFPKICPAKKCFGRTNLSAQNFRPFRPKMFSAELFFWPEMFSIEKFSAEKFSAKKLFDRKFRRPYRRRQKQWGRSGRQEPPLVRQSRGFCGASITDLALCKVALHKKNALPLKKNM